MLTRAFILCAGNSSLSSSPSSSVPNSPASSTQYTRPNTLHGLKHKLAKTFTSPHRRKSVGHIPLSPLARTPSPSPAPTSPTRSPSPLAMPLAQGYVLGSSQHTQVFHLGASPIIKKTLTRPKSQEMSAGTSPLVRRTGSYDRLHPNAAATAKPPAVSITAPTPPPQAVVTESKEAALPPTDPSTTFRKVECSSPKEKVQAASSNWERGGVKFKIQTKELDVKALMKEKTKKDMEKRKDEKRDRKDENKISPTSGNVKEKLKKEHEKRKDDKKDRKEEKKDADKKKERTREKKDGNPGV